MTTTDKTQALERRHATAISAPAGETFGDIVAMGEQLVRTGFLPAHIRTGPQFAAIVLTGRELGMPPMRAVRSLQMVKGKVIENADSQLARFKGDGGRAQFRELTDEQAVLWLRHPNGDEHVETWSRDDSRRAGLLGGGSNHDKFPRAMLRSRAITAGLKSIGWEGGVGAYDPDEMPAAAPEPQAKDAQPLEPEVIEPEVVEAPSPALSPKPTRKPHAAIIDWRERLRDADAEGVEALREEVRDLANGSLKVAHALELAADRRHCELSEVAHDPDARGAKALAWIDGLGA